MSDSLSRLVEAVRSAGVDIAPGYCEYVRLAFAIANDCGEAGREGFITLCSLSVKFNREKAERLFSNALNKGDHRIHLGTAFHLAELAGVRLEPPSRPRDTQASNASNANNAAPVSHTRTCTLYTSNQTFIRLSGVSYPDRSMPFLRSFSVEFLFYINVRTCVEKRCCITCVTCIIWGFHKDIDV